MVSLYNIREKLARGSQEKLATYVEGEGVSSDLSEKPVPHSHSHFHHWPEIEQVNYILGWC
jgi:hypothetical protein